MAPELAALAVAGLLLAAVGLAVVRTWSPLAVSTRVRPATPRRRKEL
jgi:hypothetical protein